MDTYAAEYDALEKKQVEEANEASLSDEDEEAKPSAEEQGQFRPGTLVCRAPCSSAPTYLIHLPILSLGIIDGRIRASLERIVARWNAHSASLKYADLPLNTDYRERDEALGGS